MGLFFLWPHLVATSSGSIILNSQPAPVQQMMDWQDLLHSSSSRNCHSWMGPEPLKLGLADIAMVVLEEEGEKLVLGLQSLESPLRWW